jgi:hypothetical protein
MKATLTILFTSLSFCLFAQLEKTIHQTFNVTDARNIAINLPIEYEVKTWPGDAVLVETNIKLEQATSAVMNFVVENGRYQVAFDNQNNGNFAMTYKNPSRAKLKTKSGECVETITTRIFVPDFFEIVNKTQLFRKN